MRNQPLDAQYENDRLSRPKEAKGGDKLVFDVALLKANVQIWYPSSLGLVLKVSQSSCVQLRSVS